MTKMPFFRKWQKILTRFHDGPTASRLILKAQSYYEQFCSQSPPLKDRYNRNIINSRILPAVSMYKVLMDENNNQGKSISEIEALFKETFFVTIIKAIHLLNFLPNPFLIVRPMLKTMTANEYLPGSQEILVDSPDCFAFNVYRCFYLDTLIKYNAPELTLLFCKTDDWLSEAMPKVRWERTKTLGRGGECCDFRWCKLKTH
ncbi:MAG TPA: L-2-amino-thiazoline-4-carboxylic acid hydrolase [Anaerolineales bacterium]|jgi:hypothetical protein